MNDDATLRQMALLLDGGLQTRWQARAYSAEAVAEVLVRLQPLAPPDLHGKMVQAGFTRLPYVDPEDADGIEQSCATCMYFERHRGWCDLPELMLPVRPEWSCVLWRI